MPDGMFAPDSRFVRHMEQFADASGGQGKPSSSAAEMQEALKAVHRGGPIAENAEGGPG